MSGRAELEKIHLATISEITRGPESERARLIEEYKRRSEEAFAPTTRRNYVQMVAMFREWCAESGHDPTPPVSAGTVAAYIDYLGGKVRPTTIGLRLWAINEMHRASFTPSPCKHRLVELALKAVKRTYGAHIRQAAPLSKPEVLATIERLGTSRIEMRDKALLWIASDSWCRSAEITAFRVRDLETQSDGSSLLFVARSKTDQYGEGAYAYLSRRGTEAVLAWIKLAALGMDEPILTKSQKGAQRTPLDPATVSRIMKRRTGRRDVSAHSTRIGGVQDAFRLGCDLSSIMVAGRWNSPEMPARYGRRILASQSAAAQVCAAFEQTEGQSDTHR
ncbi:Phage integrase family protein [Roseivivax jejudonensis]|uniref:Phage integrase family protein n=1 Tax=Roseivivax jejudonensis TaxID=1529041 RepID=A0A1X6YJC9_9RHOB|nr:recombinase XerD [Roseivivax jejudonensis]SLN23141.1 Phage integrase family protein [Roseivivax jejudonensis]